MGRYAEHSTCDAALKIDLAEPAIRTAINHYNDVSGVWRWSHAGVETASVAFSWSRRAATLTLRYCCNGDPVTQTLRLIQSTPHYGGARYWFCCPITGASARVLYLPAGASIWASRCAYKLTYQSQRDGGLEGSILRLLAVAGSPLAQGDRRQQTLCKRSAVGGEETKAASGATPSARLRGVSARSHVGSEGGRRRPPGWARRKVQQNGVLRRPVRRTLRPLRGIFGPAARVAHCR